MDIAAFGRDNEANLVEKLRPVNSILSYILISEQQVIGHILFSQVVIEGNCPYDPITLRLAPMAILPEYQQQGIGSLLLRQSLLACYRHGGAAILVLVHREYYPRFGFIPDSQKYFRLRSCTSTEKINNRNSSNQFQH